MQILARGYRGLSSVLALNTDRILSVAVLLAGLVTGAYVGMLILTR